MEIVVGTYEEFVLGYRLHPKEQGYQLKQSFANHAHTGSVRSVSTSGKLVASGGVDESIRLFNLKKRAEVGSLLQHNGTVNKLQFCEGSHLASCSDDGTICIWNTNSWQCLKTLRGHKGAVNSVCIHGSGKLAFSVSKDKSLRTWNLVKGRSAYVTNIKDVAETVLCSPDRQHFAVVFRSKVDIYKLEAGGVVHSIDFGKQVLCIEFLQGHLLAIGGEKEEVEIHDIQTKCLVQSFKAHDKRLKGICSVEASAALKGKPHLVTASSDGFVKLWRFNSTKFEKIPKLVSEVNTKCRITCIAVSNFCSDQIENEDESESISNQEEEKHDDEKEEDETKTSHVSKRLKRSNKT